MANLDADGSLSPKLTAPRVGIEPTTVALTGRRSTAELPGNMLFYKLSTSITFQLFFSYKSGASIRSFLTINQGPFAVKPRSVTFKRFCIMQH